MLPDFLVIGAEKCGTSWLYDALGRHPDIYLPDTKEVSFFNRRETNLKTSDYFVALRLPWYERFYDAYSGEGAAGDVSPMYLCDEEAPGRIAATIPSAKLIAILRDPVERVASHYWMAYNKKHVTESLEEVVTGRHEAIVRRSLYGEQIGRYFSHFRREQILVLIFEEVMSDRRRALETICDFIGVDSARLPDVDFDEVIFPSTSYRLPLLHSASVALATALRTSPFLDWIPRLMKKAGFNQWVKQANSVEFSKPPLPQHLRDDLNAFYAEDREKLEALLDRKIETWPR